MSQGQSRGRVLVVDDEPDLVRILQFGLQSAGYVVESASDGQEGLKKAREVKPDIILLDLMLPKLDGYKICRLLKFDERFKQIPIIILSARTQEGDQALALEMGANRFVTKPYNFSEILTHVEELLKAASLRS
ncbi:MAG: response regulator [Candidatus Eisenbacteria bacterium]|jgi:two-component system, OmpR family, alkaline phosphatase synthesis response regulator PhoP|uniref:Response regulator n=1 Tax=Eiseniibacteriota bacterium TaxID=2212470 RepID=A0A538TQV8_UNCEI|nr:MAG: response regulator [Candidatus Eisenbacteria bacterium]